MEQRKSTFKIGELIKQQKKKGNSESNPINLEAIVNSGRVKVFSSSKGNSSKNK